MAHWKFVVTLQVASAIPEDRPVNTFHYVGTSPETNVPLIATVLETAYNNVRSIFSTAVAQNGHSIKAYDMADPEPRAPIYDGTFNFATATTGTPLPTEVALCVSFQGVRVSGQSQARRRGRVYLGPLATDNMTSPGRPSSGLVSAAAGFGNDLLSSSLDSGVARVWSVYSPSNDDLVPVANGWVDNAYDIQRRRGVVPTARTLFVGD